MKSTGELTSTEYPKFRVITVVSYDLFQSTNKQINNKLTSKSTGNQQATNKVATTDIRTYKNNKNNKKEEAPPPDTDDIVTDFRKFCEEDDDDDW